MHSEILSNKQKEILSFVKKYKKKYYFVGGTAIAFHIGHRSSIDFDLITDNKINFTSIKKDVSTAGFAYRMINELSNQIHFLLNDVKLTFFEFPFEVESNIDY